MDRIGIITFHRSYNYGSILQAFALQKYIKENVGEAKIIDFIHREDFKQYHLFRKYLYKTYPTALGADIIYFVRNLKRKRAFELFIKKYISLTDKRYKDYNQLCELNSLFDVFICGSDQIWNPDCTNGVEPAYYLQFSISEKRKVAYAPSMGHLVFKQDELNQVTRYINRLDFLSIREKSILPLLQKMTDKEIKVVVDPTLLLEKKDYIEIMYPCTSSGYIFVYMLEDSLELIEYAQKQSLKMGKKIVYISKKKRKQYRNAVNIYGISPEGFLSYLNAADYIITNSFHATIFSIIFEKKFCTFSTKKSFSRMTDLLERLDLKQQLYHEGFLIDCDIDFRIARDKLNIWRTESIQYLKEIISKT